MSSNKDEVTVIGPDGRRKTLPRAAAESPDVKAMGYQIINDIDYGVQRIAAPVVDEADEEVSDEAIAPARRGRKPKAQSDAN